MDGKPLKKNIPSPMDWREIISCVETIESVSEIPVDCNYHSYVRVQRFVRERHSANAVHLRDGIFRIAERFDFNLRQAARLFCSLDHIFGAHQIGRLWESQASNSATATALNKIEKSIERVANFSNDKRHPNSRGVQFIVNCADRWAEKQKAEELQRYGFSKERIHFAKTGGEAFDYNSTSVVRGWFELAPLILQLTKTAKVKLEKLSKTVDVSSDGEMSAIVVLVGGKLPHLYERVTGQKFTVSNVIEPEKASTKRGVRSVGGVGFVIMVLETIGLGSFEPETVASYRKQYRKALKRGVRSAE